MIEKISRYIDLSFLIKFLLVFVPLYYLHLLYFGLTDPNNYYSPVLDENLNYINWLTSSINHTASLITNIFGIYPTVNEKVLYIQHGPNVYLEFSCLGLGLTSFWVAFIVAHNTAWRNKLYWCLGGAFAIWFLNCWRIAILLISLQENWEDNKYFSHHDIFNFVCYCVICLLMFFFYRSRRTGDVKAETLLLKCTVDEMQPQLKKC